MWAIQLPGFIFTFTSSLLSSLFRRPTLFDDISFVLFAFYAVGIIHLYENNTVFWRRRSARREEMDWQDVITFCGFNSSANSYVTRYVLNASARTLTPCAEFTIVTIQNIPLFYLSITTLFILQVCLSFAFIIFSFLFVVVFAATNLVSWLFYVSFLISRGFLFCSFLVPVHAVFRTFQSAPTEVLKMDI